MAQTKTIKDYQVRLEQNRKLGAGGFGQVYKAKNKKTNQEVAVKIIRKNKNDEQKNKKIKQQFDKEINILRNLNHKNILKFYDQFQDNDYFYIFMELCDESLADYLKKNKNLTQQKCIQFIMPILQAFYQSSKSKKHLLHRDLKPLNILLKNGNVKIADFGLSKIFNNNNQNIIHTIMNAGTLVYMSPQLLQGAKYTDKYDVWSFGVIIYELLHGKLPWSLNSHQQLFNDIKTKEVKIQRKDISENMKSFLQMCLFKKQHDRASWATLTAHPLYKKYKNPLQFQQNQKNNQQIKINITKYQKQIQNKYKQIINLNKLNEQIKKQKEKDKIIIKKLKQQLQLLQKRVKQQKQKPLQLAIIKQNKQYKFIQNEYAKQEGRVIISNAYKTIKHNKYSYNNYYNLIDGKIYKNGSKIKIKIQSLKRGFIQLGICIKSIFKNNYYQIDDQSQINHGAYLIYSYTGWTQTYTLSHSQPEYNRKSTKIISQFKCNDIISVEVNENQIKFIKQTQNNKTFSMPIKLTSQQFNDIAFCIRVNGYDNTPVIVSIIQ